jgi:hypothetical protein
MFDGAPDWALAKSPEPRRSKGSASSSLFDHYYMKDSEDAFAKAPNRLMRQRSATLVDQAPGEIEIRKRSQYIAPIGDMSPYPLNVATGARALHSKRFSMQANYRWSKWLDTSSDTSTGQFADNSELARGGLTLL